MPALLPAREKQTPLLQCKQQGGIRLCGVASTAYEDFSHLLSPALG